MTPPCQFKGAWSIPPNVIFCNPIENRNSNLLKSYVLYISSEKAAATMTEEGMSICKSNDLASCIHSLIRVKDHIADGLSCMVSVKGENWRNFFLTPFSLSFEVGLSCPCQLTQVQLLEQKSSPALSLGSRSANCCLHCACVHWECAWLMLFSCQSKVTSMGSLKALLGWCKSHSIIN